MGTVSSSPTNVYVITAFFRARGKRSPLRLASSDLNTLTDRKRKELFLEIIGDAGSESTKSAGIEFQGWEDQV